MKLLAHHKELITHLYTVGWRSPLEIADELGLTFRQVCRFLDRTITKRVYAVARNIEKSTRAGAYPAVDVGYTPPDWHR